MQQITVSDVRSRNAREVFDTLAAAGPCTRLDVARATSLSVVTVSSLIDALVEQGLVRERKDDRAVVGRRPKLVELVPESRFILAIDLATREFSAVEFGFDLSVRQRHAHVLDGHLDYEGNLRAFVRHLAAECRESLANGRLIGVGVSTCAIYQASEDRSVCSFIPELESLRLGALFAELLPGVTTVIDKDVLFAAEAVLRGLEPSERGSVFYAFVGEGVGGALALGGAIVRGASNFAGEFGLVRDRDGRTVGELVGWHLVREEAQRRGLDPVAAWQAREAWLETLMDGILSELAVALANLAWTLNPALIILEGPYCAFGERFRRQLDERIKSRLVTELAATLELRLAAPEVGDALSGAAGAVRTQWLGGLVSS
ncbi:MAG: hypothetical protein WCG80_14160 [Spirochaetales bacterium]